MRRRLFGWIVQLVIGLGIVAGGLWTVDRHTLTAAELDRDSLDQGYRHPVECDGLKMGPGDECVSYVNGEKSGTTTYEELASRRDAKYSVEGRRSHHAFVRTVSWGVAGLGLLLIVWVPVSAVRTARQDAAAERGAAGYRPGPPLHPAPPAPALSPLGETVGKRPKREPVTPTVIWVIIGALGSFVAMVFVIEYESVWSWLGGIVGLLLLMGGGASLVDMWRTRVGRRRWARARGFVYRGFDHDLVARLGLPGLTAGKPFAEYLVYGTYQDRPFVVFSYRDRKNAGHNAWAMALPGAVPPLAVEEIRITDRVGAGSAPGWRAVWPSLSAVVNLSHPDEFLAGGTLIWEDPKSKISGVNAAELERRLHGLYVVGSALAATPVPETVAERAGPVS
ncbi:hypothetical protein [Actinoplanes sp. L3-i22]|uniref:hypothetical protein n=1 Tax=Actinoplanes sp. L3-i22 TaxID=2836373 RepID=UPI001C7614A0|nr:hypothetical protein [Actinoplanes sp. L3-i22]BCY12738.1 hypothetical protein L3i22_078260 [Actinoplanes sp. L3-i22]